MTDQIPPLRSLAELADAHDGFILDVWGVLHDGTCAYPGVNAALAYLAERGKRVCLLSNAPRRAVSVAKRLRAVGVDPDLCGPIISSGEATHNALRDRADPFHAGLGRRLYHLGPERDRDCYEGLDYEIVAAPEQADFVLNTGIDKNDETVAMYEDVLSRAAARRLPMICANPDRVVVSGEIIAICAGELAHRYAELSGGPIQYHGKPHPPIYAMCFAALGLDKSRICAVGDAFHTDIAGANAVGIASYLCLTGIHRADLGAELAQGGRVDAASYATLAAQHHARPTGLIRAFAA